MLLTKITVTMSIGLLVLSCAKEKPFETVYKEAELMQKSAVVDTEATFLYVPSTLGAPKDVEAALPFYKGDEKLVKFKFTEKTLDIVEVEKDSRFQENAMNNSPVLSIPVEYKDFRCTTNKVTGECLNKEEENTETVWSNKNFFKPDFATLKINEVNSLDLFNLDPSCISEVESGLVNYEMTKDVLNIELEKTYKVSSSPECINNLYYNDELSKAGFKMRFFYSLVKLDKVTSSSYKPVNYPIPDHDQFGFFKTKNSTLNDVYDSSRPVESYLLHRWNPDRGTISYYLSEAFNKKENAYLKEATYKAFERINEGLREANSNLQLKLEEPKKEMIVGDIRYSTINLIDDPLANGLLGYGPVVVNPQTGEIVKGHVNMYGGVLMTTVRSTYESMVDLSKERAGTGVSSVISIAESSKSHSVVNKKHVASRGLKRLHAYVEKKSTGLSQKSINKLVAFKDKLSRLEKERMVNLKKLAMHDDKDHAKDLGKHEEKRLTHLGKMGACSAELISVPELAKKEFPEIRKIDGITNADGSLKAWDDLSDSQRTQVIHSIMTNVYVSTLIHEMGHNLGLRHNFMGSFDKKNFYTDTEAAARGFHTTPVYTSIMDYGYSELNALTIGFGKYDVAALRFAYAREVEDKEGNFIKVEKTLSETENAGTQIKSYGFCTDENAGLSISCNRFDEGSSSSEIAAFHVKRYNDGYKYRNLRNGRAEFTEYGMAQAVASRNNMFKSARLVYEEYEFYESIFGTEIMEQGCTAEIMTKYPYVKNSCEAINDKKLAVETIGKMFLDILKTPDLSCAVAKTDAPKVFIENVKLYDLYQNDLRYSLDYVPTSCFDPNVVSNLADRDLVVIAEAGRYLNSIKDPNPIYPYVSDIAVRGLWPDKLLAMKMLTIRYFGNLSIEERQGSFADITSIKEELSDYISHVTLGTALSNPLPFHDKDGNDVAIPYSIDLSYVIPEQYLASVSVYFDLPITSNVELVKQELLLASRYMKTTDITKRDAADKFLETFGVYKKRITDSFTNADIITVKYKNNNYGLTSSNEIATSVVNNSQSLKQIFDLLSKLDPSVVEKVYNIKKGIFEAPADFTETQKQALKVPLSVLNALIKFIRKGTVFTEEILVNALGEEMGKDSFAAYSLGEEGINAIIAYINTASVAPADASDDIKMLYGLDTMFLEAFINNTFEAAIEQSLEPLSILPEL